MTTQYLDEIEALTTACRKWIVHLNASLAENLKCKNIMLEIYATDEVKRIGCYEDYERIDAKYRAGILKAERDYIKECAEVIRRHGAKHGTETQM